MSALNNDEAHFLASVSQATGIDPRVIAAWMYEEGAFKKGGTGGFNYLNLRATPTDGHTSTSPGGFSQFPDVNAAIAATIQTLNQANMKVIINAAHRKVTPGQEISAIAASPWDKSHYGGNGQKLVAVIEQLFGGPAVLTDRYESPDNAQAVANTVGTGSAADWTSYDGGNAVHDLVTNPLNGIVDAIEWPFKWLGSHWERILLVLGGAIVIIIALLLIANSTKSNVMSFKSGGE